MFFIRRGKENRRAKRVPVGFDLLYKAEALSEVCLEIGKEEICTHMFDLSEGGMAIKVNHPVVVKSDINITFHVIFKEGQTSPIYAKGIVVYCTPLPQEKKYRIGIKFTDIPPEDIIHIAELVKIKSKEKK